MHKVFLENEGVRSLLHDVYPDSPQKLSSGKFVEEVSQIPSFSFTLTPENTCYNNLHDRKTRIIVQNVLTKETEFEGIVLTSKKFMKADGTLYKSVVCEGFMGYLCDSVQMYCHYEDFTPTQFLQAVLEQHNAQVSEEKWIYLGLCNISGNTNSKTTAYRNTLEEIKENLTERLGGEIRVRRQGDKLYLDYLDAASYGTTSDTVVELSTNMKTLSVGTDATSIITRLFPLGTQTNDETAERLTIEDAIVNGQRYGKAYIDDAAAIAKYGIIAGTAEFDDITIPENLYSRGLCYLQENNRARRSYEATVLDLSTINNNLQGFRAGNTYRFRNRLMHLDEPLRVIRRSVDIFKPYAPTVVIGDKTQKITDIASRTNRLIDYEIPKMKSEVLTSAKAVASSLITSATTGYVVVRPHEILIMDTDDTATATSVWRMNSGGIGYSHSSVPGEAYDGEYGLAMTMNGQIVADFITAGTMYADRIRGGTLTIGGADGKDGVIQVLDDAGKEICRLDKNGASILGSIYSRNGAGYWVRLADGSLKGGNGDNTYTTINATAQILDGDAGITYHGLLIDGDAVYIKCKLLAVNGGTGTSGGLTVATQAAPILAEMDVVTDAALDENGALQLTKERLQYMVGVDAGLTTYTFANGLMVTGLQ